MHQTLNVDNATLWTVFQAAENAIARMNPESTLGMIERHVSDTLRRVCKSFNNRRPEVVIVAHEMDPR